MKARLNAQGVIILQAENGLEDYALIKWTDDAFVPGEKLDTPGLGFWNASKLMVLPSAYQDDESKS